MKKVILLGRINLHKDPIGGETAKNQNLLIELRKFCKVYPLDFYNNKKRLWIFPYALLVLMFHPKATLILSTDAVNIYGLLRIRYLIKSKRNVVHWVIGGKFDKKVQAGRFDVKILNCASCHLVEGRAMKRNLTELGVNNVKHIINFRCISYFPVIDTEKYANYIPLIKFVYFGRIVKPKGIDNLLEAIRMLNDIGYADKFTVDFYGMIGKEYENEFNAALFDIPNARYGGFLDLKSGIGYDVLAQKHVFVFPTCHEGEGVAGAIIDSYVSGLPVIATKWNCNEEVVLNGKAGMIIPPKDSVALFDAMKDVVDGKVSLGLMSRAARHEAERYKAENVITKDFLKEIGVM